MNRTIIILSALALLFSCGPKSNKIINPSPDGLFFPEIEQRTVIIGTIDNLKEFPSAPTTIKLSVDDIAIGTQNSFETVIGEDGRFMFDIPFYHSVNSYLNYGDAQINPYLFVNDTLKMNCKIGKKGYQIGIVSVVFDKGHDKFQNQFNVNYKWLHYYMIGGFRDKLPKNESVNELKDRYLNFQKELLAEIDLRVKRDSLDSIMSNYLIFSAKYALYDNIIRLGNRIPDRGERVKFYSFLNDSVVFNKCAMVSSDYCTFLSSFNVSVDRIRGPQISAKSKYELIKTLVEGSFSKREGIWGEYLAASILINFASQDEEIPQVQADTLSDLIGRSFNDKYIRQYLLNVYSKTGQKTEANKNLKLPAGAILNKYDSLTGEQMFNKIVAENAGKVIYLDIWGTWCSPCIAQMKYSKKVHELFKGEAVTFIYLCDGSSAKSWETAIKKHQIEGSHIYLNASQYGYLKNRFSFVGVPRYLLIDKHGKVVNADAPVPENEALIAEIKKLLSK